MALRELTRTVQCSTESKKYYTDRDKNTFVKYMIFIRGLYIMSINNDNIAKKYASESQILLAYDRGETYCRCCRYCY
jgi:hypothetical protein